MRIGTVAAGVALAALPTALNAAGSPADELAAVVKMFLGKSAVTDWQGVEMIPGIRWAPLPPVSLQNCLPDGGCFTRQGQAAIGGRSLTAVATGARTIVNNLYLRNAGPPFGEAAVVSGLKAAGFSAELARCPVAGAPGGTNWYRLSSGSTGPGVVSIQTSCAGKPCEGFVLTRGGGLPALQPAQMRLYSEQCGAPADERKAVAAAGMPHELLARALFSLIPAATGPVAVDWKRLVSLAGAIEWNVGAPKKADLSYKHDANPFMQTGQAKIAGRLFSVLASGSAVEVRVVYVEETGMHPRGEHVLGEIYKLGAQVQLARCGPVYTSSTNNWYSLRGANIHPVMLRQSLSYDGNQVGDSYELRLDNTLPRRDARDRDPGVGGCR